MSHNDDFHERVRKFWFPEDVKVLFLHEGLGYKPGEIGIISENLSEKMIELNICERVAD